MQNLPTNYNVLSPVSFRFTIKKLPNVSFFCQSVTVPEMRTTGVKRPSPLRDFEVYGDTLEFGILDVTFLIDEDLANYMELYNWLRAMTSPDNFSGYNTTLNNSDDGLGVHGGLVSDATLHILTNSKNTNKNIQYKDIFPTRLGGLNFESDVGAVTASVGTVTFSLTDFTVESVT
jgi:hypothetical protein